MLSAGGLSIKDEADDTALRGGDGPLRVAAEAASTDLRSGEPVVDAKAGFPAG